MRTITIALLYLFSFTQNIYSIERNFQQKTIDVLNITATVNNDHVEVSWQIYNYENNYFAIVERSANAVDFTQIDTVYIAGPKPYMSTDFHPISGTSYYRIRFVCSSTKKESISNLTYIEYEVQQKESFEILNLFPIPFSETLNTIIRCKSKMMITFKLTDLNGRLIYESSKICNEGINTLEISEIVKTGNNLCYLTLSDEKSKVKTIQLLKQNTN